MIQRHKTAMARSALSKPVGLALQQGVLQLTQTFFDYGCGRGGDVSRLSADGFAASGWDPAHAPNTPKTPADIVNLGYVVNVIEEPRERVLALESAWALAKEVLIVAARPDWEASGVQGKPFRDGVLTSSGTFQRFYAQNELQTWIEAILETSAIAAAPGIFFVFRNPTAAQGYLASRVRYRANRVMRLPKPSQREALFEANRHLLEPMQNFLLERGRMPTESELALGQELQTVFGSLKNAYTLLCRVVGDAAWEQARVRASDDCTVILALGAFKGRPKFDALPPDLQLDIKAFFGNYKAACQHADELLFRAGKQEAVNQACAQSNIGKITPDALYIHRDILNELSPLLRIYEGCARVLTGEVEATTLVKLSRLEPKVSYLVYPDFEKDPHPALLTSVRADFKRLDVKMRDYSQVGNPPVLHRKETFVTPEHPLHQKFSTLTKQEVRAGLLEDSNKIGTRVGWQLRLEEFGYVVRGHRLFKAARTNAATRELPK
jgi:DNA phosphorothioation-associated putative methyltransferase